MLAVITSIVLIGGGILAVYYGAAWVIAGITMIAAMIGIAKKRD